MTNLLQLVAHLLDTSPKLQAYPTCKSIVITNESSVTTGKPYVVADELFGASDDSSVAINGSSVGTNFWFCPNLVCTVICIERFCPSKAWYYNMYPTGKSSVATDDVPIGYTIVNY
uniref:Uncharacterized protein n=1 Tax=Solanum tuberosum TaxID=4113 RepID=M1DS23_SOLTU